MKGKTVLMGHASLAVAAAFALAKDMAGAVTPQELAKRTATPARSKGKAVTRAAVAELVTASHAQLVLAHIQPRWLRGMAAELLDAGVQLGPQGLDRLRAFGPERGRELVNSIIAQQITGKPANG